MMVALEHSEPCFIGVGVGPGDPELMTLKSVREIRNADVICYLVNQQGHSQARAIASLSIDAVGKDNLVEIAIVMPMSEDRNLANQAYDEGAEKIITQLGRQQRVIFLCEGDPLMFGSFAYLLERIEGRYPCQVVPGISSIMAGAAALPLPLTMQRDSLVVISGRHDDDKLIAALQQHQSVVIMKAGRARPRILAALKQTGRLQHAKYLEYIGRENQHIVDDVSELDNTAGPYFSLFIITAATLHERSER
ncbi:Precorrin-2 C(20)-methyltransferase [Sinobacterium norvegicum]|uniref:Precorrin-2 C(20)-methyltransferase n=1 Tax=Sinobacterium norvegicum TaxID=1641715 RepID=A0ABM9AJG9_9GAMM|nr:precorrin-2 C(20)-methyltransferase [Sinobacterium norvegicum]CAH0993382.1 Precorrin-2 C(20)-methyltransferase [Sinobacterium norvegicum]